MFNFMQIQPEGSTPTSYDCYRTPSTTETEPYRGDEPIVGEFDISEEVNSLNRLVSKCQIQEKENQKHLTDRFIPIRKWSMNYAAVTKEKEQKDTKSNRGKQMREQKVTMESMFKMVVLGEKNDKLLRFSQKNCSFEICTKGQNQKLISKEKLPKRDNQYRKISKVPYKVLDAPNIQDDFYLNLLEWSSANILSVALQSSLYFWNANNNKVLKFCDLHNNSITSLSWNISGDFIGIGTNLGTVEIWDANKCARVQTILGHNSRVSSLAWNNGSILASGSRDHSINIRDLRSNPNNAVKTYQGHLQEVCGLKWSFDGHMLASGGNDNKLLVWGLRSDTAINRFTDHTAAVKGIAWSPHNHGILASGGGSVDRTIKFWNTLEDKLLDSIDTGSQVCNLMFSKTTKQIVSTHGFSNNQIIIWKYPTLQKTATLTGHSSRVLFLAGNPAGDTIVTGAGDETLRFWNVFPTSKPSNRKLDILSTMELR